MHMCIHTSHRDVHAHTNSKHASSYITRHLFHDGLLNVMFGYLLILIKDSTKMRVAPRCHDPIEAAGKHLDVCVGIVCVCVCVCEDVGMCV